MPSRRAFLTGAGATVLVTLTGCSSRETSDDPSTTSKSTTPDTLPPDAASFEADLVRDATADHPPRFAATLTNEGSDPFTATFGFAPPLSVTTLDATEGDASLFCYTLNRRNTTAFTPWIRAVTPGNKPRSDACFEFQHTGV